MCIHSQVAHDEFPDKFILYTEACAGERPLDPAVALGSWGRGERYMNNIIEDLNHWAVGWTDWNMALDMEVCRYETEEPAPIFCLIHVYVDINFG